MKKSLILNHQDIIQKIKRISFQIVENNFDEKEIHLIGIKQQGFDFAKKIQIQAQGICDKKIILHSLELNKKNPIKENHIYSFNPADLEGKVIVFIDDVANSGKTLFYALNSMVSINLAKLQVAVLIDRKHKRFPISADYVGVLLSTTMRDHISVVMDETHFAAYLT